MKKICRIFSKRYSGVEEEKYSAFEVNLLRCEYKLSYNIARSKNEKLLRGMNSQKEPIAAYTTCTEKELKKVDDLVDDMKLKKAWFRS
jgi:hypothetical protein